MEDGSDEHRGSHDDGSDLDDEGAPDNDAGGDPNLSISQDAGTRQPSDNGVSLSDVPGAPEGVTGFELGEEGEEKGQEGCVHREEGMAVIYPRESQDNSLVVTSPPDLLDSAADKDGSCNRGGGKRGALPQGIREALQVRANGAGFCVRPTVVSVV